MHERKNYKELHAKESRMAFFFLSLFYSLLSPSPSPLFRKMKMREREKALSRLKKKEKEKEKKVIIELLIYDG